MDLLLKKENNSNNESNSNNTSSNNNNSNNNTTSNSSKSDDDKTPNFDRIYTFLGSLFDPSKYNHQELMSSMSLADKECLKVDFYNYKN